MSEQPTLTTARLVLRPFRAQDAPDIQRLASDRDVAATTLRIPHPYLDGMAETWLATLQPRYEKGESVAFAITRAEDGVLLGAIGLEITREHERADMGYWIGKPYWGNGYCTEAATTVVSFAFDELDLHRITAEHFAGNTASGRVMRKVGMSYEGHRVHQIKKWGKFVDVLVYGLIRPNR